MAVVDSGKSALVSWIQAQSRSDTILALLQLDPGPGEDVVHPGPSSEDPLSFGSTAWVAPALPPLDPPPTPRFDWGSSPFQTFTLLDPFG